MHGAAHTEGVTRGECNCLTDGCVFGWLCVPYTSHVVSIQFVKVSYEFRNVVGRVGAVTVKSHNHFSCRLLQPFVQSIGNNALRIVEQLDEWVFFSVFTDYFTGIVSTPAIDEEHLELILRIVLLQNRQNAPFNELLFIEKRAND